MFYTVSMQTMPTPSDDDSTLQLKVPLFVWIFSLVLLIAVAVIVVTNLEQAAQTLVLLRQSQPIWLCVALILQILTYVCAGGIWYQVALQAGYRPSITSLASLAIETLSVNQIIPVVGIAGNVVVVRAMKRMGLPYALAMEAILVEIISQFIAYALLGMLTLFVLSLYHDITPVILWVVSIFSLMMLFGLWVVFRLLGYRERKVKGWLWNFGFMKDIENMVSHVSPERVQSPALLLKTSALYAAIFLLDGATLWATLHAVDLSINPLFALAALVIASMAGTISLLPGSLGSFEAASAALLVLLGASLEGAVASTLLLRAFSFWLPLMPGLLLARRDMR